MALKAVLPSLDGVDESLKSQYTKNDTDGRFYLAVEGIDEMPAVVGLRQAKQTLLDEKKKLESQVKALGVSTPEEVQALKDAAAKGNSEKVTELENKLRQASESAQREIASAKEAAEKESAAARQYFENGEITRAIGAHKGEVDLLAHVVRQSIKTERGDDGAFRLQVLGKDGQPRIKDSSGAAFGLDDLVGELKAHPVYARAFPASGTTGSGAAPTGGGGGGGGGAVVIPKSASPQEYRRLKADAETRGVPYQVEG